MSCEPIVYTDASYACHADYKSRSGTIIIMAGGVIGAYSHKQSCMSTSTTQAELIALDEGVQRAMCVRNFLKHQGKDLGPTVVFQDNKATIKLVENGGPLSRCTRHINIKYFTIAEYIGNGNIKLEWCASEDMLADMLTKPLGGPQLINIVDKVLC